MTRLASSSVNEETLSAAWLETCRAVSSSADKRVFHQVTRIARPTSQTPAIRREIDEILDGCELPSVETVANTIFPAALARSSSGPQELGERYRRIYPRIKQLPINERGTYFGRIVAYPTDSGGTFDQLTGLLDKLRTERATRGPMSARYEISLETPNSDARKDDVGNAAAGTTSADREAADAEARTSQTVSIVAPLQNTARMAFPCLSLCSFQLDGAHLHLVAHYRSQYMIQRAYGNYLGLGRLLDYVARAAELEPGELMVVAGYAQIDGNGRRALDRLLRESR